MDRTSKEALVAELKEMIVGKASVVLTEYKGMTVAQMYELRREFDKVGAGYKVVKNTLAKLAIQGTDYEFLAKDFTGTIAIAYSDDPVAPAKVLAKFGKEIEKLKVKVGYLGGKPLAAADVDALSKLPGKDELRAKLLSVFNAPATNFVGVLSAGPRDFVSILRARGAALGG